MERLTFGFRHNKVMKAWLAAHKNLKLVMAISLNIDISGGKYFYCFVL